MNTNEENDYKIAWCEQERLRQENSVDGWIYIGLDTRFCDMAKIGLTTGKLGTRASGSQNPFYALLCAFKIKEDVPPGKIAEIENAVIIFLSRMYKRILHTTSGKPSEWFYANPHEMRGQVHDFIYSNYNWCMCSYHCSERDIGVIHSWENNKILYNAARNPYQANDLSAPFPDPNCYMPGGCGADCNCWD